jgi:hypothetical protein
MMQLVRKEEIPVNDVNVPLVSKKQKEILKK